MKCPVCNTDNPAGETFCTNCGALLSQSVPATGAGSMASATNAGSITYGGSGGGTSRTLAPGARLENGRYVIEKVLGQGGMGAALLAKDTRVSNKLVVIKELISDSTDPVQRQEDVRNFEREVETVSCIDHPLVPNVTDSFHEGSHYFMVQEYVAGENLEDRMERVNAPMPEREALTYASQVLDILDYLEQQKPPIVHRDIKPANIIISNKDKRAHLVDFGIARAEVAKKQTSALGTPGYAPPEQYQGKADPRSDLYALAATIHHLVTNRDPRNYPPFSYPSARSINPQVLPELDRLLSKELTVDINKRYQTAAEMKRDVDNILTSKYKAPSDTSSYLLGQSGPVVAPTTPAPAPQPVRSQTNQRAPNQPVRPAVQPQPVRQAQQQQVYPTQRQAVNPAPYGQPFQPQAGTYRNQPARQSSGMGKSFLFSFLLLLLVVGLIGAALFVLPNLKKLNSGNNSGNTGTGSGNAGSTATATPPPFTPPASGIGVQLVGNDHIGISDGSYAFDTTNQPDASFKTDAANSLRSDTLGAESLWRQAIATEPNDAEAQIYLEDQLVLDSGRPYIDLVVGTMLSQDNIGVGRDDLQGAFIAQKEFNASNKLNKGTQVRLLVASSGSDKTYAALVAQQVVKLAKNDNHFAGVMGWPFSSRTSYAIPVLRTAGIPMVSQTSSDDSFTGISPYFFRVAPSNKSQGIAGAQYAETTLHAKNVALFVDYTDPYSQSLASDFSQRFIADGGKIVDTETYKVNHTDTLPSSALTKALNAHPDLIYFSGYAADISTLLTNLPSDSVPVLGGDALYELGGYQTSSSAGFTHLKFTAFFYPDMWTVLGLQKETPAFFQDYAATYGANGKTGYGYTRVDSDAALSYDATVALLMAYNNAAPSGGTITPAALQQGLTKTSFQGVSGHISFDANGNPINKAIVILKVDSLGRISMEPQVQGTFA